MILRILKQVRPTGPVHTACVLFGLAGTLYAWQTSERVIDAYKNDVKQINDAVLISNISVAGKTVECGLFVKPPDIMQPVAPFQAGSNWLQQMTISLVNRTQRTIVFGGIIFHFLDTGNCESSPCVMQSFASAKYPQWTHTMEEPVNPSGPTIRKDHPSIGSLSKRWLSM